MRKGILLLLLISMASFCIAQDKLPTVVPDRPGYTWGAEVTPWHKISWDNGFAFDWTKDEPYALTLNSTILRYGIFENVELRVGTDFLMYREEPDSKPVFGIAPLAIGTKIKLYEGNGVLPAIAVLAELKSPHIGAKDQLPSHLAPAMYAIFEHAIGERFSICYHAGLEWDGETTTPTTFLALALGYSITESLGTFVETYNYLHPVDGNQYMTEFGLTWLVSRRVQLDIEADLDFQHLGQYYSIGCGVAWMIN